MLCNNESYNFADISKGQGHLSIMAAAVFFALLVAVVCRSGGSATTIQWYRTAQGTNDRLTKQTNVTFGGDFTSDTAITVDRYRGVSGAKGWGW